MMAPLPQLNNRPTPRTRLPPLPFRQLSHLQGYHVLGAVVPRVRGLFASRTHEGAGAFGAWDGALGAVIGDEGGAFGVGAVEPRCGGCAEFDAFGGEEGEEVGVEVWCDGCGVYRFVAAF